MSDEDIALKAVSAAQEILEEYLEPRPRSNERMILDRLVEVLGQSDLFVAVSRRMQRANGASSGRPVSKSAIRSAGACAGP
ncbi:hypothetical protein [Bradyrhizobium sp. RD5-C2]|uniref:hypothetical protein n=1 Tax=Bradyrhizobium sp. RD5-C2 TaxID=244562 RepID=UPI001CC4419F|nr:hypothetical protein [Bradyrhizobium sp. RD5-C2]